MYKKYIVTVNDTRLESESEIDDEWLLNNQGTLKYRKLKFKIIGKESIRTYNNLSISKKVKFKNQLVCYG